MAILSKLLVALGLDATDYQKGLEGAESTTATRLQGIGQSLGNIGQKATATGMKLTAGVTAPIVALGLKAMDSASDLEESLSKVNVVFGDTAGEVIAFSEGAAEGLGQSQQEALEAAGTYGNLFTAMGIGVDVSKDMSLGLVTLASDLASFNNAAPIDTLDALRAGLSGETEPLKRFGININAAAVATKALDLGLVETTVDMNAVEKATLGLEAAESKLATMTTGAAKGSIEYRKANIAVAEALQRVNKLSSAGGVDQMALREANLKVQESQLKLAAAIEKSGEGSIQAQKAALSLEKAESKLAEVQQGGTVDAVALRKARLKLSEAQANFAEITQGASEESAEYREQQLKVAEAEAALEGALAGTTEELTAAQKAQAVYALVMDQTVTAQGDFQRTADGLANSTRIAKAQLADAAATMGTQLLPIGLKVVSFVSGLIDKFKNLSPETQKTILIVAGLAAAIGPLLMVFGTLISSVGAVASGLGVVVGIVGGPVLAVIAAVVGAIALLALAWNTDFLGIRTTLTEIWENTLKPIFLALWEWLQVAIPAAIAILRDYWETVLYPAILKVADFIKVNVVPILEALGRLLKVTVGKALEFLAALWKNVLYPALKVVWDFIKNKVQAVFVAVVVIIEQRLGPVFEWLVNNVLGPVSSAFGAIGDAVSAVLGFINNLINGIKNIKLPAWLQPGSPTPFEIGLIGINRELRKMAENEIPRVDRAFGQMAGPGFGLGDPMGAGPGSGGDHIEVHNYGRDAAALTWAMIEDRRRRRLNFSMG